MTSGTSGSTMDNVRESARSRAGTVVRAGAIVVLVGFLGCGAAGLLGVHSTSASVRGGGYELDLRYATIARAGLDVPWTLTLKHPGGFGQSVVIAVSSRYFQMFETQGWSPEPSAESQDSERRYLTFDPPPDDTLVVDFDAYIQPSSQRGAHGVVSVWENGTEVVSLSFATRLVP